MKFHYSVSFSNIEGNMKKKFTLSLLSKAVLNISHLARNVYLFFLSLNKVLNFAIIMSYFEHATAPHLDISPWQRKSRKWFLYNTKFSLFLSNKYPPALHLPFLMDYCNLLFATWVWIHTLNPHRRLTNIKVICF